MAITNNYFKTKKKKVKWHKRKFGTCTPIKHPELQSNNDKAKNHKDSSG